MDILLADDDAFIRQILGSTLQKAGHSVTLCADGQEAIDQLKDNAFNVVITDLIMPNKDGGAVIDYMRSNNIDTPILAISAGINNNPEDFLPYAGYLADDTLEKPIKKDDLLAAVNNLAINAGINDLFASGW